MEEQKPLISQDAIDKAFAADAKLQTSQSPQTQSLSKPSDYDPYTPPPGTSPYTLWRAGVSAYEKLNQAMMKIDSYPYYGVADYLWSKGTGEPTPYKSIAEAYHAGHLGHTAESMIQVNQRLLPDFLKKTTINIPYWKKPWSIDIPISIPIGAIEDFGLSPSTYLGFGVIPRTIEGAAKLAKLDRLSLFLRNRFPTIGKGVAAADNAIKTILVDPQRPLRNYLQIDSYIDKARTLGIGEDVIKAANKGDIPLATLKSNLLESIEAARKAGISPVAIETARTGTVDYAKLQGLVPEQVQILKNVEANSTIQRIGGYSHLKTDARIN